MAVRGGKRGTVFLYRMLQLRVSDGGGGGERLNKLGGGFLGGLIPRKSRPLREISCPSHVESSNSEKEVYQGCVASGNTLSG